MTLFLRLTRHSSCGLLATEALAIHLARLLATKVLTIHLTGGTAHIAGHSAHSVRARRAALVVQLEVIGDIELAVIINTGFSTLGAAVDFSAAAHQVDIAVRVNAIALAVNDKPAAHHVEGVVQHTFIQSVAVRSVDRVIRGDDGNIAAVNVHNSSFKTFIAAGDLDGGTFSVLAADGENVIRMDRVITCGNGEVPAEERHVIVDIDAIVDRIDVYGYA